MRAGVTPATILVVDDDAAVRQVLCRVLAREGHVVYGAADAAGALRMAAEHPPQLALIDLCLGDEDGTKLARELRGRRARLPLILVTGHPLRLHQDPGLARPFVRVLTKPVDVTDLRLAVTAALSEGAMQPPNPPPPNDPATVPPPANGGPAAPYPPQGRGARLMSTGVVVVGLVVLAGFLAFVIGVPVPGLSAAAQEETVRQQPPPQVELLDARRHVLSVPPDVREALGLRRAGRDLTAVAEPPKESRPLVLSGSTALDPTRLMRVRARFAPAEVVEIGTRKEYTAQGTTDRELRAGDRVGKGDLLGVFYSIDVGTKKNDLVDALVQLKFDQDVLDSSQRAYDKGAVPYLDLVAARKSVQADYNAINKAENSLRLWAIPEEEIEAVRKEAAEIVKQGGKRDRSPEHVQEQLRRWARVELRAPDDGTVVERNVNARETVVDNTVNLFQIAQVDRLLVIANAPEDELPTLQALTTPQRRWTVRTVGAPAGGIPGAIDDISYLIDVNQHSAVVKGRIPNGGELRSGQFVTATIRLPPPENVVEIPLSAVADDGKQSVVFVQPDKDKPGVYALRRVEVAQRLERTALVRSRPDDKEARPAEAKEEEGLLPREPLAPGELVITAGVLELKKELEDRESEAVKEQ